MKNIKNMSNEKLFASLSDEQKDFIYRKVLCNYTKEDVLNRIADQLDYLHDRYNHDFTEKEIENIAEIVTNKWDSGDFDCNLSYWDNIDSLIYDNVPDELER